MKGEIPVVSIEKAKVPCRIIPRLFECEIKRKICKPSTCKKYERLSNYNLIPAFEGKRLDELTCPVIQKYLLDKDVKSSADDRGYTDYSSEYLIQEAQKINYSL